MNKIYKNVLFFMDGGDIEVEINLLIAEDDPKKIIFLCLACGIGSLQSNAEVLFHRPASLFAVTFLLFNLRIAKVI